MGGLTGLFVIGAVAAGFAFFHFEDQLQRDSNAREVAAKLHLSVTLVHGICDRPVVNGSDKIRLTALIPDVERMILALADGGRATNEVWLPKPVADSRLHTLKIREAWERARPKLQAIVLAQTAAGTAMPAGGVEHQLAHPEVAELESEATTFLRWLRTWHEGRRTRGIYTQVAITLLNGVLLAILAQLVRRRVLTPIRQLEEGATHIRSGDFSHRVPAASSDELGMLARSFNGMSAHVERLLTESQQAASLVAATNLKLEREVEDHRRTTSRLGRSEARLERAQQISHTGNWELILATKELYWSAEVFRIFGLAPDSDQPDGSRFWAAVHPEDLEAVQQASRDAVERKQPYAIDHRIVRPDGSVRVVHEHGEPRLENGELVAMEGIVQDISEYKQLEAKLQHVQKLEAVGRLAGGIAHDFNNLLTVVLGFTQIALETLKKGKPVERYLELVLESGERASALTAQLLAFSRKQRLHAKVVDVNQLVTSLQPILRQLLSEEVELTIEAKAQRSSVKVDPTQLEQILMNLASNARDAMPTGGFLLIQTENVVVDEGTAAGKEGLIAGAHVLLTITDNGVGMDAETLGRAFEPFFTTKEQGKGTGLGLATVYGTVKQSGGDVSVYSEPGRGTSVRIYLPLTGAAPDATTGGPQTRVSAGGSETVMVVEDEPQVRALTTEVLRAAGYQVLDAADFADANEVAGQYPHRIDLLLTDVVMPGGSGPDLAHRLTAARKGLQVVFMSGYPERAISRSGGDLEGAHFLPKPFKPSELLSVVRNALSGGGAVRSDGRAT